MRAVEERLSQVELRVLRLQESVFGDAETTRRWARSLPDTDLTWGTVVGGDAFVREVDRLGGFGPTKTVVEIGPGYGRLLEATSRLGFPFAQWVGLDISRQNVEFLAERFPDRRTRFLVGNVETYPFDSRIDTVVSSLVFKHLQPSFARALSNLRPHLAEDATVIFDLIEAGGDSSVAYLEHDPKARPEATFIRKYTRPEVVSILTETGFELQEFGHVTHQALFTRLLVVARPKKSLSAVSAQPPRTGR